MTAGFPCAIEKETDERPDPLPLRYEKKPLRGHGMASTIACLEKRLLRHGSLGGVDDRTGSAGSGVGNGSDSACSGVNDGCGYGVNLGGCILDLGFGGLLTCAGSEENDAHDGEKLLHLAFFCFFGDRMTQIYTETEER